MKNKPIIITVVACLIVGAAAFFGGMQYQKMQRTQLGQSGANGQRFGRGGANSTVSNVTPVRGQIISADSGSITVKMQDGSSKIVILPDSVNVMEATSASKQALTQGQTVMVIGMNNSDGSVTAQNVQINPQNGGGFGGGRPGGSARPQGSQAPY